jgi:hypothetical protein
VPCAVESLDMNGRTAVDSDVSFSFRCVYFMYERTDRLASRFHWALQKIQKSVGCRLTKRGEGN